MKTDMSVIEKLNRIIQEEDISAEVRTYLLEIVTELQVKKNPSDIAIGTWLALQKFQTEQGQQEYQMYFDVDMPKIIRKAINYFNS